MPRPIARVFANAVVALIATPPGQAVTRRVLTRRLSSR
jgi:hypothetical protein